MIGSHSFLRECAKISPRAITHLTLQVNYKTNTSKRPRVGFQYIKMRRLKYECGVYMIGRVSGQA